MIFVVFRVSYLDDRMCGATMKKRSPKQSNN